MKHLKKNKKNNVIFQLRFFLRVHFCIMMADVTCYKYKVAKVANKFHVGDSEVKCHQLRKNMSYIDALR